MTAIPRFYLSELRQNQEKVFDPLYKPNFFAIETLLFAKNFKKQTNKNIELQNPQYLLSKTYLKSSVISFASNPRPDTVTRILDIKYFTLSILRFSDCSS